MDEQKKNWIQVIVIVALLVMTLPLFYLLVSRVLLPLEWDESQWTESVSESQ